MEKINSLRKDKKKNKTKKNKSSITNEEQTSIMEKNNSNIKKYTKNSSNLRLSNASIDSSVYFEKSPTSKKRNINMSSERKLNKSKYSQEFSKKSSYSIITQSRIMTLSSDYHINNIGNASKSNFCESFEGNTIPEENFVVIQNSKQNESKDTFGKKRSNSVKCLIKSKNEGKIID